MVTRLQVKRTATDNNPPADGSLLPGELFLEMGEPVRLWAGVPTAIDASGKKVVLDTSAFFNITTGDARYLKLTGGGITGNLTVSGSLSVAGTPVSVQGHTHAIADTTGLQTALDSKVGPSHSHPISDITGLQTALDGKAATSHTHTISQVTNLQTTLDGKSNVGHTHIIADVAGLQAALDALAGSTGVADGAITTAKLADGAVTADKLATSAVITTKLADAAVSNAKLANMAQNTFKGRLSVGSGPPEDIALSTLAGLLGSIPTGVILPFAGNPVDPPSGWLWCSGQAVSRTAYAALFAVIGTTYGAGDGSTSFNLPDLRGRTPIGNDAMNMTPANRVTSSGSGINGHIVGSSGGTEAVTLTVAQLPPHNHGFLTGPGSGSGKLGFSGGGSGTNYTYNTGSGTAHQNMQPSLVVNYIIKL